MTSKNCCPMRSISQQLTSASSPLMSALLSSWPRRPRADLYRGDRQLTDFEAFGEEDLHGDGPHTGGAKGDRGAKGDIAMHGGYLENLGDHRFLVVGPVHLGDPPCLSTRLITENSPNHLSCDRE